MNYAQEQRLRFIDVLFQYNTTACPKMLAAYFGVNSATATRDFRLYIKHNPRNCIYKPDVKRYQRTFGFKPMFNNGVADND